MKINKNLDLKKELKGKSFNEKLKIMKKVLKNLSESDIKNILSDLKKDLNYEIDDPELKEKSNTLNKYSPKNQILILLQNPYSEYLLGYKSWKQLNRTPIKGTGIFIYSPNIRKNKETNKKELKGFSVKTIFDFKDTVEL